MIFRFAPDIFKRAKHADIIAAFRFAAVKGHSLFVADTDTDGIAVTHPALDAWIASQIPELRVEINLLVERIVRISPGAATRGAVTVQVVVEAGAYVDDKITVDLPSAIRMMALPLFILVENAISDSAFVRRAMPQRWKCRIAAWEKDGLIQFEHGGGIGEMQRIVTNYSADQVDATYILSSAIWKVSHFLISDRDCPEASSSQSPESKALSKACRKAGISGRLHVLERRDQESYIPHEALKALIDLDTDSGNRASLSSAIEGFFADSKTRLFERLPRLGGKAYFKNVFVDPYSKINWSDQWFIADMSGPEMVEIAEKIASFI